MIPSRGQLELARREYFLDLELWTDPFLFRPAREDQRRAHEILALGLNVPCLHLPTRGTFGEVDITARSPVIRRDSFSLWMRCLDLAESFGAEVLVAHVEAPAADEPSTSDELHRFAEVASTRRLSLALETQVGPRSSLGDLIQVSRDLPRFTADHGLCIDLAREPLEVDALTALGRLVKWVEISGSDERATHLPPDESVRDLRPVFESLSWMPWVAFEVVTATTPGHAPGDAELTMLLRRIRAWMRDYGQIRHKEGVSPHWPMG